MGFIQLLASLWPFLKEMFVGEKINDPPSSKRGSDSSQDKKEGLPVKALRWSIGKMQKSKRFLTVVILILLMSLFVNYKLMRKVVKIPKQHRLFLAQSNLNGTTCSSRP
jgi:hypothetical protein